MQIDDLVFNPFQETLFHNLVCSQRFIIYKTSVSQPGFLSVPLRVLQNFEIYSSKFQQKLGFFPKTKNKNRQKPRNLTPTHIF